MISGFLKKVNLALLPSIESLTHSGYQGIKKTHANCVKPVKGTKKRPLTKEDKKHNHYAGSKSVMVEHIVRELKIFKIIAAPYRNRREKFGLGINLIAAICNF
jgi:DDE superfamily endonuclease